MAKKIGYLAFDVVRNEWLARVGFTRSPAANPRFLGFAARFKTRKAAERWLENKQRLLTPQEIEEITNG